MSKISKPLFLSLVLFLMSPAFSAEPTLTIQSGNITKKFTRSQLLKQATEIVVKSDASYTGTINYQAVPAKHIFKGIMFPKGATLVFKCLDGFSAPISQERLLNLPDGGAVPYIAIESPKHQWPLLKGKTATAGPFYLVWLNPEKSKIGSEEWPYQLSGFEVKESIESQFPGILPDQKLSEDNDARKGFQVFLKNCFACHTMNGEGHAQMGPDLNLPYNPTEYLNRGYLLKLIRNPQNLRQWPQSKMSAFSETAITDAEVSELETYLKHMVGRKKK